MSEDERRYREKRRLVGILFLLYVPVCALVGFSLAELLDTDMPFFIFTGSYIVVLMVVSVQAMVAYFRWKPMRWLSK